MPSTYGKTFNKYLILHSYSCNSETPYSIRVVDGNTRVDSRGLSIDNADKKSRGSSPTDTVSEYFVITRQRADKEVMIGRIQGIGIKNKGEGEVYTN